MIIQPQGTTAPLGTKMHISQVYKNSNLNGKKGYFRAHEAEVYLSNFSKLF